MDPVSGIGLVASLVQIIDVTIKVINCLNDIKDAPKDRTRISKEAVSLLQLLLDLRERVQDASPDDLWYQGLRSLANKDGPLDQYLLAMEKLTGKLQPEQRFKKMASTLLWSLNKKETKEILEQLARLNGLIQASLQKDQFTLSLAIRDGLKGLEAEELTKQKIEILDWVSTLDFTLEQEELFSRWQPGTGEWFLNRPEVQEWLQSSGKTLYCPGIPGSGKSVIASLMVDQLQQSHQGPDVRVVYIYCNYKREVEQTPTTLITSILRQLIHQSPVISNTILSLRATFKDKGKRPSLEQWTSHLLKEISLHSKVYLVIDALDELSETNNKRMTFLREIEKLRGKVNLCLTSRYLPAVQSQFSDAETVEIHAKAEDVETYLRSRIRDEKRLLQNISRDPSIEELIVKTIVVKCNSMFLLATLQLDSIARKHSCSKIRKAIELLPLELDSVYEQAIERIGNQTSEDRHLAHQVLTWITYARERLTVEKLQHALALEPGDTEMDPDALPAEAFLVDVCAGLVTIDTSSRIIRFVHFTVEEYMARTGRALFPEGEKHLASACLTYLCFNEFSMGCCKTKLEYSKRIKDHPFLDYAASYWDAHARVDIESLRSRILEFLRNSSNLSFAIQVARIRGALKRFSWFIPQHTSSLHWAAAWGDLKILEDLVSTAASLDEIDPTGNTPLSIAITAGHSESSIYLIEKGASVNTQDLLGRTPLMNAARVGSPRMIRRLLDAGADANLLERIQWASMPKYEQGGIFQLFWEEFVSTGATSFPKVPLGIESYINLIMIDATWRKPEQSTTAPSIAELMGWTELFTKILCRSLEDSEDISGQDLNGPDRFGRTPLFLAASQGNIKLAKRLLNSGADPTCRDSAGLTAADMATKNGEEDIVSVLREHTISTTHIEISDGFQFFRRETVEKFPEAEEIWLVEFSHNGSLLAVGTKKAGVKILRSDNFEVVWHHGEERSAACRPTFLSWSRDDSILIECRASEVPVWSAQTGQEILVLPTFGSWPTCAGVTSDRQRYIVGSFEWDRAICEYDSTGKTVWQYKGTQVRDLKITPNDQQFVVATATNTVIIFDTLTKNTLREWGIWSPKFICIHPSSLSLLVFAGQGGEPPIITSLDVTNGDVLSTYYGHKQDHYIIRCSYGGADCEYVVSGSEDGDAYIWAKDGTLLQILPGDGKSVNDVAWHPKDPSVVVTVDDAGRITKWTNKSCL